MATSNQETTGEKRIEEGTGTLTPETGTKNPNLLQCGEQVVAGTGTSIPETGTSNPNPLPPLFALDMGQGRFVVVDGPTPKSKVIEKRSLVEVMKKLPKGAILVAEATLGSFGFDFTDYNDALDLAAEKNIELRAIAIRAVKNRRMDPGHDSTKNNKKVTAAARRKEDILEARLLWELGQTTKFTKPFTKRQPRVVDTPSLAVRKAMDGKYKAEAAWLKANGFDPKDNLLLRIRAVAAFVRQQGQNRDAFDKACGFYEYGSGIVRAQACYHKRLRARLDENTPGERRDVLRELRKLSRKIFALSHPQMEVLQGTGTANPETGTDNPNPATPPERTTCSN
jgi:hypothetical protein